MVLTKLPGWTSTCLHRNRTLTIKRTDTNETFEDEADVLVSARGSLSDPSWPNIPGLKSFKGETMHSALWKERCV